MSKILIVDDNEMVLRTLIRALKPHGFDVTLSANGADALEKAREVPPDLIISDILMPVMDGFELCREWKKDKRLRSIPFVFLTATFTEPEDEKLGLQLGATRFISKWDEPKEMVAVVKEILQTNVEEVTPKYPKQSVDEADYLRTYCQRIVNKLEEKVLELEKAKRVLKKEMAERKRVEAALESSQKQLELIIDKMPVLIGLVDSEQRFLHVNQQYADWYGVPKEEIVGKQVRDVLPEESYHGIIAHIERALSGQDVSFENIGYDPDGRERVVRATYVPYVDENNKAQGFLGVVEDITESKQAEKALMESEEKFSRAFRSSPLAVLITRLADGQFVEVNEAVEAFTGYRREELIGRTSLDLGLVNAEDRESVKRILQEHGSFRNSEYKFYTKSGEERVGLFSGEVIEIGGESCIIQVVNDITERKLMEEGLRESEERFRLAFENANIGMCLVDLDGRLTRVNSQMCEIFGYNQEELESTTVNDIAYPEDLDISPTYIRRASSGETEHTQFEKRYFHKQGHVIWGQVSSSLVRDSQSKPSYFISHVQDITERKLAEEALRMSEEKHWLVSENIPVVVYSALPDEHSTNLFLSGRALELTGHTVQEFLEDPGLWEQVIHPDDVDRVWKAIRQHREQRKPLDIEYRIVTEGDVVKWIHDKASPMLNENEEIVRIDGFMEDITERKRAEDELKYRAEFERHIAEASTEFINLPTAQIDAGINRTLQTLGQFVDVDRSYVFLFREDGVTMDNTHEWCAEGIEPQIDRLKGLPTAHFSWSVGRMRKGESLPIPCVSDLPSEAANEKAEFEAEGIRSLIVVPIIFRGETIGFLGFDSVRSEKAWSKGTVALLRIVGEVFANALSRKRAEEALHESEVRFRSLIEHTTDAVFCYEYDPPIPTDLPLEEQMNRLYDGVLVECNNVCAISYGASHREEVVGRKLTGLFGTTTGSLNNLWKTMVEGDYRVVDGEGVEVLPDGTKRYYLNNGYGVVEAGSLVRVWGTFRDITDRKHVEDALETSRERLRAFMDAAADGFYLLDKDLNFVDINRKGLEITGLSKEEIVGRNLADVVPDVKTSGRYEKHLQVIKTGKPFQIDHHVPHPQFGDRHFYLQSFKVGDGLGVISTDITERKLSEAAIRRSSAETARSQRLLLALSEAAQAVQQARTPEDVYKTIGEEIRKIGYHCVIFRATEELTHLELTHMTLEPSVVRAGEKLTGLSAEGYRLALIPGGFFDRLMRDRDPVFSDPGSEPTIEALPKPLRHLAGRLASLIGMEKVVYVPFEAGDHEVDLLAVLGKVSENDIPAMATFARQAAIAIRNAKLFQAAQQEIAERKQAERRLKESREQLRSLSAYLQNAREQERASVAREIHDELGQNLTALRIDLGWLRSKFATEDRELLKKQKAIEGLVDSTISIVQRVTSELRPGLLDDLGLAAAVEWQIGEFERRTGIKFELAVEPENIELDSTTSVALFRVLQEALTNVARHAKATKVVVVLRASSTHAELSVKDDGKGISKSKINDSKSLGLIGMRERAAYLGGALEIVGEPDEGTEVHVSIPLSRKSGQSG